MTMRPGAPADDQQPAAEVILSREQLGAATEWVTTGSLRVRRRVVTATRTVEVEVRREELVIDTDDVEFRDGVGRGVGGDARSVGQPVAEPGAEPQPLVILLREEVPDVRLAVRPYEQVTVRVVRVAGTADVAAELSHEEVQIEQP